jgi:hypothetical protein
VSGSTAYLVQQRSELSRLESETVNDHLRMLEGIPLAQVTGGLHEVKSRFSQVDFAPAVQFAETTTTRRSAVEPSSIAGRGTRLQARLHTASLFVIRADGRFPDECCARRPFGVSTSRLEGGDQGYAVGPDRTRPSC